MAKSPTTTAALPRDLWEEIVRRAAQTKPKLTATQLMEILLRQALAAADGRVAVLLPPEADEKGQER